MSARRPAATRVGGNPFLKGVALVSTLAGWISAALIVGAVALTAQMIFVRFVLNGSTVWQTEAVVYLAVGAALIGLPYVQSLRGHVSVDLVPHMLGPRGRMRLRLVTRGLSATVVAVMLWHAFEFWHLAYERGWRSDTVWGVSLWKPYLSLPLGFALLLLQLVADLVSAASGAEEDA